MRTAGRTVLFSAVTVAAALSSLLVFPQRFLFSMGIGGALVALVAALVALTLLPALLAALGPRVNALSPRRWRAALQRDAAHEQSGFWYRLSRAVMRRPGAVAASTAALLIAARPARSPASASPASTPPCCPPRTPRAWWTTRCGRSSPSTAARRCWWRSARPRRPAPSSRPTRSGSAASRAWRRSARPRGPGRLWRIDVVAPGGRLDERVQEAVRDVRAVPAPYPVLVGGSTAEFLDQQAALADGLPRALAWLTVTTLVILFLMTGSVVLPVKTLIMNLLTVSAAFGLLVLIFQDGRLEGLLDYTSQGALESSQPILLFAIAFGLSTDYGVFLLTRIKEARDGGLPNDEAVAVGLERTGRIVTAAALLLVIAIGAFATSEIVFIKQLGIGTAAGRDHRRHDRARAARAVADEAAGRVELVGAAAAGAAARPHRPARGGGVTAAAAVHAFDADTALEPVAEGRWRAHVPAHWLVARGANGGFLAAVAARAAEAAAGRPLRSLALHFLAAPGPGPLDVATVVERAGRMTSWCPCASSARGARRRSGSRR